MIISLCVLACSGELIELERDMFAINRSGISVEKELKLNQEFSSLRSLVPDSSGHVSE